MRGWVNNSDVVKALRGLKRKLQREGVDHDMRRTAYYLKPSVRARLKHRKALARQRKIAAKYSE
jgi:ribosomal protein S21